MLEYLEATFQIPLIFIVLCYALGTAVFIGTGQWARIIALGQYNGQKLWGYIGAWMLRAWIAVILFSLSTQIGVWQLYIAAPDNPHYAAELVFLLIVSALYIFIKSRKKHYREVAADYVHEIGYLCLFLALSLIIWGVTIFIFFLFHIMLSAVPSLQGIIDPSRDAVMVIGVLWLYPFIYWYQQDTKLLDAEGHKSPEHYKFYMLLWPIVIGLFFFIIPLFAQKMVTSEKFQEMMDAKSALERV